MHERDDWTILRIDPTSGELLDPDGGVDRFHERAF